MTQVVAKREMSHHLLRCHGAPVVTIYNEKIAYESKIDRPTDKLMESQQSTRLP